jgi:CheY-like chemotaxis protein
MAHKLLLADDSVTIQRVIELTFADEDIDVTTVGDGQLAIDRLDTDPPDIVLADVDMPKRDGYEVAAYVKSHPRLAHIPVVLLTGAFEPIDQARASASGSSDVLAKPFEPQMVINRVKELLGRKRPEDEAAYALTQAERLREPQPQMGNPQPASRQPAGEGPEAVSLDDYFDQLDAAFSNLQPAAQKADGSDEVEWPAIEPVAVSVVSTPSMIATPMVNPAPATPDFAAEPVPVNETAAPIAPAAPVALIPPVAPVVVPAAEGTPMAPLAPVAPVAPLPPAASTAPTPTANPFANLSAAKAEAAARPPAPIITDELIEEIVSRVMQRMSDRVVRETVTDIVSQTAERLVQEEIERIKMGS